ncbi:D-alanine--D-alanine ligase family protein [Streptomyces coffeae]|uniref:ATP-grasp domain-containing protein n=1 Tax=Streptomyces coffeae TaxID=621382 RepID=A0ABS1NBJ6_9ACTN|nr:ATP-grasp domain-containing protein [Streptomyces coffeae]MBL1097211.1 ATP-grasp domain-containing protein [Streptomyces coffeae]
MDDIHVVVLRAERLDPLDGWGDEEAVESVVNAMVLCGIRAESKLVRSVHDLERYRDRPGLLAFPHSRRLSSAESLIEPLEAWGVPLVGSGSTGLAAQHKGNAKRLLAKAGVPTPAYALADHQMDPRSLVARLGLPLVVKPVAGAESVGVVKCDDLSSLRAALRTPGLLVEEWKRHRELTVAILGNGGDRIAAPAEVVLPDAQYFLDVTTKRERITSTLAPAPDDEVTREAVAAALEACRILDVRDWARVDVLIDHDGKPYVIDVNAMPGMRRSTDHPSYLPWCFALDQGMPYHQVVSTVIGAAAARCGQYDGFQPGAEAARRGLVPTAQQGPNASC